MSSISATERSKNTDETRSAREEYNDKEAELIKKQKRELKRAAEQNDQQIQALKDEYGRQIDELKSRSRDALTEKDERHQKSIDQVRSLYTEQLRRKQTEAKDTNDSFKQTYEDKLKKEKDVSEQQKSGLKRNFSETIKDRDREYKEFADRSRETTTRSIAERASKQSEKHNLEMREIREDRDNKLAHAHEVQAEMKTNYEGRIKDKDRTQISQLQNVENSWSDKLKREQENTTEGLKARDTAFQQARRNMQEDMQGKTAEKMEKIDNNYENLKETVGERVDNEVKSAQSKVERLKYDSSQASTSNRRIRDLERKDLVHAYEQRMGLIEGEKREIFDKSKVDREEKISQVVDQQTKILQETNLENRMQANMLNTRNREDRGQLEVNLNNQMEHTRDRADLQVKRVMSATNKTIQDLDKNHRDSLDQAKNNFQENLAEQRDSQTGQLQKTTTIMQSRLRDLEAKHMSRLDTMKENYETKIEKILDDHKKEMAKMEDTFQSRNKQEQKAQKTEVESINQKNETKFSQLEEIHQKEIDRLEKRHQEQMNNMVKQMSYYKKNS